MAVEGGVTIARYRLLDTTRAYALEKLAESGEAGQAARRHAEYYAAFLATPGDRRVDNTAEIDNIRAALAWAFGPDGDVSTAVRLTAAAAPVWLDLSLLSECADWMAKAVGCLTATEHGTHLELQLAAALGFSLMFTTGMSDDALGALTRAVELAERLDDPDYQLRTLFGLCVFRLRLPDFRGALALARQCEQVAGRVSDPSAEPTINWMLGLSLFCLGDVTRGQTHMERVRDGFRPVSRRVEIVRFGFDQRVYALGILGLARWIQGFPERAMQESQTAINEAYSLGHPVSLCIALWTGCLVSLWVGDAEALDRSTASLLDHTKKHALENYHAYGLGFAGELAALRGDLGTALRLLGACLEGLRKARHQVFYSVFLGSLGKRKATSGDGVQGLAMLDEALERAEQRDEAWYMPELLRIKGELLASYCQPVTLEAEDYVSRSLALAHRQEAKSWALRAAVSLASMWRLRNGDKKARELVTPIYESFTEGFETADLRTARSLLDKLHGLRS